MNVELTPTEIREQAKATREWREERAELTSRIEHANIIRDYQSAMAAAAALELEEFDTENGVGAV